MKKTLDEIFNTGNKVNAKPSLSEIFGAPQEVKQETKQLTLKDRLLEAGGDLSLGIGKDIAESSQKRADNISETLDASKKGEQDMWSTSNQVVGQLAGAGADAIGALFKGVGNVFLSDEDEKGVTKFFQEQGTKVLENPQVQKIIEGYKAMTPEEQRNLDALGGLTSLLTNFVGGEALARGTNLAKTGITGAVDATTTGIKKTTGAVVDTVKNVSESGIAQTGKELVERVPRALGRVKENIAEAGVRAEKIKNATPAVQEAIKSNLDNVIIDSVVQADDATKQAYKKVVEIAERPKTIGKVENPAIVGGDIASEQADLIFKQKKNIGAKIGEEIGKLSTKSKISIDDTINEVKTVVNSVLKNLEYSPAQKVKVKSLLNLINKAGKKLTPKQIQEMDRLFSKLQREAKFEGVEDIMVKVGDKTKNLYSVMRDIYSNKLSSLSPTIKKLNNQYRKVSNIVEDIEDSIFKTPNYNIIKSVDPAEFAKVNLRRIFGEAGSSPVFEAIADMMDKTARGLGYSGATPKQVAAFAEYIRKLYPETIPKTGFQGGIKMGVSDILENISKVGAPNIKDQQNALRKLLESLSPNQ